MFSLNLQNPPLKIYIQWDIEQVLIGRDGRGGSSFEDRGQDHFKRGKFCFTKGD